MNHHRDQDVCQRLIDYVIKEATAKAALPHVFRWDNCTIPPRLRVIDPLRFSYYRVESQRQFHETLYTLVPYANIEEYGLVNIPLDIGVVSLGGVYDSPADESYCWCNEDILASGYIDLIAQKVSEAGMPETAITQARELAEEFQTKLEARFGDPVRIQNELLRKMTEGVKTRHLIKEYGKNNVYRTMEQMDKE